LADENTPYNIPRDLSPYGMSKHLAEGWVARAVRQGLDAVTLNPTVILGAGDLNQISGSLVLEVAKRRVPFLPQDGGTNFINVEDVARAHIAAAEKGRAGERYIVGNQNLTHRALLLLISQVVGVPAPVLTLPDALLPLLATLVDTGRAFGLQLPVDGNQLRLSARQLYFDTSKMRRELYEPQVDIQQTIEETWAWYQARGLK
jgi:dihydroflavonol-4-reductase